MTKKTQDRKQSHLTLCSDDNVSFKTKTTLFEDMELSHRALNEINLDDIDLSCEFANQKLDAPLFIGAMTGGAGDNGKFNKELATIANDKNVGLCLGSMRPMLEDKKLEKEFQVRKIAKDAVIMANLGGQQLLQYDLKKVLDGVKRIEANGIAIHLNAGMELIQPWGDKNFKGIVDGIEKLVKKATGLAVSVKETGMGLSFRDGEMLKNAGVQTVETAGAGGTSWIGVETCRAEGQNQRLGSMLWDFGIPTAVSTAWMVDLGFQVISSGGVYNGLDMAKAIALGAQYTAVARPLVKAYRQNGIESVGEAIDDMITGLRYVMLCVGAQDLPQLASTPRVIGPKLTRYIETGWQNR